MEKKNTVTKTDRVNDFDPRYIPNDYGYKTEFVYIGYDVVVQVVPNGQGLTKDQLKKLMDNINFSDGHGVIPIDIDNCELYELGYSAMGFCTYDAWLKLVSLSENADDINKRHGAFLDGVVIENMVTPYILSGLKLRKMYSTTVDVSYNINGVIFKPFF